MKRLIVALILLSIGLGSCSLFIYLFGGSVTLELAAARGVAE